MVSLNFTAAEQKTGHEDDLHARFLKDGLWTALPANTGKYRQYLYAAESAFTRADKRDIFRAAVFL